MELQTQNQRIELFKQQGESSKLDEQTLKRIEEQLKPKLSREEVNKTIDEVIKEFKQVYDEDIAKGDFTEALKVKE